MSRHAGALLIRRRVLTRAEHRDVYIHPSLIADVRNNERHVLGGRDAADAAGLPVGISDDDLDVYLRAADLDERTSDGQRPIDDVAFLLGLPFNLRAFTNELEPSDSDLLNQLRPRVTNPTDPVWDQCPSDHRDRALTAYGTLIRASR